jgi:hypothetical protein
MKFSTLAVTALVVASVAGGSALAQVTMQPIPNPPEKMKAEGHKAKHHHKMADAPKTDAK